MPKRAYRVTLSITVLVQATSQQQADEAAQVQLEQICKQVNRIPAPEPRTCRMLVKKPEKIAKVPAGNSPRPFAPFGRN